MINVDNLLQQFKQNAKIHFDIDYGDKTSIKKGRKAVETLFAIAENFKDSGKIDQFAESLNDRTYKVDLWTAHILLERLNAEDVLAQKALTIIESYARLNNVDGYAEKLWLEEWLKSKQNTENR